MTGISIQSRLNQPIIQQNVEDKTKSSTISHASSPVRAVGSPSFTAATAPAGFSTKLTTKDDKHKYQILRDNLDKEDRKKLELLLKSGKLLNNNSNDKSTVLDNLYGIITKERAEGLTPKNILKETITTIANPYVINQQFGDIPKEQMTKIVAQGRKNACKSTNLIEKEKAKYDINNPINEETANVEHSGSCVSASIEFNLAKQMPAEFARFVEGLTSPRTKVEKTIKTANLANNTLDAVWLLNAFEIPYQMDNFNEAKLTLAPDKNAILRARIQDKNKGLRMVSDIPETPVQERSLIDVLLQSTFMNVGSQQSYESLTDIRQGKFNQNNKGLIEFEKTFTESIVEDKNKISVTYQIVNDDAKLTGYETDFNTIKKHIFESLAMGENVIIGYTQVDDTNTIINGHEITIIGTKQDANGKTIFICNDTDDNNPNPIEYSEDYILPKIHHAGLPASVVEKDVKFVDNWVEGLNAYNGAKKQVK